MPGFDRSGPVGGGPMTGGGRGLCGGSGRAAKQPVYGRGYGYGRGMGFRRGGGRGWGRGAGPAFGGFGYPAGKTDEAGMLRANADAMQRSLKSIQRRIAELEKEGSE
ncbi:MAG: hypothetical protein CR984_06845 [Proteobacteria bacterium]|nr:MAG: hypothetical protein CR984_06845 [Pseudomonadota bacterium]